MPPAFNLQLTIDEPPELVSEFTAIVNSGDQLGLNTRAVKAQGFGAK